MFVNDLGTKRMRLSLCIMTPARLVIPWALPRSTTTEAAVISSMHRNNHLSCAELHTMLCFNPNLRQLYAPDLFPG
jgi:hypothetical protein